LTAAESSRSVVRRLKKAGFIAARRRGSHTVYENGEVSVAVPDGHRTISPGVVRQVDKSIEAVRRRDDQA
jgi:predicted RNA binding protein YcfA (HicA-like mRNA interferase family)